MGVAPLIAVLLVRCDILSNNLIHTKRSTIMNRDVLKMRITQGDSITEELGEQIVPPCILISDLVPGKDYDLGKLEHLLRTMKS